MATYPCDFSLSDKTNSSFLGRIKAAEYLWIEKKFVHYVKKEEIGLLSIMFQNEAS